jgi:hypothetical protein
LTWNFGKPWIVEGTPAISLFDSPQLKSYCESELRCVEACEDVEKHLNLNPLERDEILKSFPVGPLPDTPIAKKFYRDFETKALACAELIDPHKHADSIAGWIAGGGLRRKIDPSVFQSASTLKDLLINLSQRDLETWITAQNNAVFSLFKRADAARLGIYTQEQEADEIGIELAARVGVDPKAAQTAFLKGLEAKEKLMGTRSQVPGELDYEQCASALEDGFTQFIPIGDYGDIHHSTCFRVYNVFREVRAHEKELKGLPAPGGIKPDPITWNALRQRR